MVLIFNIQDVFSKPGDKLLQFGIQKGYTVVDYGCGPGRYIKKASELVGEKGKIFAADIHGIAIEHVMRRIETQGLKNVVPVLLKKDADGIPESIADFIGGVLSSLGEIVEELKDTLVRYLRRH